MGGLSRRGYLQKERGKEKWRRIARFRLGNEMREGRYWEAKRKSVQIM